MSDWTSRTRAWEPPDSWGRVLVVDAHTAGEPLRVILGGFPQPDGDSIPARRRDAKERHDRLRRALMWEPRGHADMYGCLVVPAVTPEADLGVLFMHNEGYSTMCGHGIIGVVTVLVELGLIEARAPETPVAIDAPAGLVRAVAEVEEGRIGRVRFANVPSFAQRLGAVVEVPGLGPVRYDLAFGGAFYAYVDAAEVGLGLEGPEYRRIIELGTAIKEAVAAASPPAHPDGPDLGYLYGTIFVGPASEPGVHSRNVCVFADGEVDRSPTGTGVSGRLAILHARGELERNEEIVIESLIGTSFSGRVLDATRVGKHVAVVPEVAGRAWITGRNELFVDPSDPLAAGFFLR